MTKIRELPDDIDEAQARRAGTDERSDSQPVGTELGLADIGARQRRRETVDRLLSKLKTATAKPLEPTPEELIRGDRAR